MKKKELFKKLLNNPKYSAELLIAINTHDFSKSSLKLTIEDNTFELHQKGNDIKIKE